MQLPIFFMQSDIFYLKSKATNRPYQLIAFDLDEEGNTNSLINGIMVLTDGDHLQTVSENVPVAALLEEDQAEFCRIPDGAVYPFLLQNAKYNGVRKALVNGARKLQYEELFSDLLKEDLPAEENVSNPELMSFLLIIHQIRQDYKQRWLTPDEEFGFNYASDRCAALLKDAKLLVALDKDAYEEDSEGDPFVFTFSHLSPRPAIYLFTDRMHLEECVDLKEENVMVGTARISDLIHKYDIFLNLSYPYFFDSLYFNAESWDDYLTKQRF